MDARHRRRWDDRTVESELRCVVEALGRFPSNADLRDTGRLDLANQIARRGGFLHWADKLGMARKASDSDTGWEGEDAAFERLTQLRFSVTRRLGVKRPFDLLVDDVLRVDVKSARLAQYGHSTGWFFRIGKYAQSDMILLWQLDTAEFYALPWFVCPTTNITITRSGGKYAPFHNNAELVRSMAAVRRREKEGGPRLN